MKTIKCLYNFIITRDMAFLFVTCPANLVFSSLIIEKIYVKSFLYDVILILGFFRIIHTFTNKFCNTYHEIEFIVNIL